MPLSARAPPGNVLPDMFLNRRRSGHEVEAEPIVNHGKAAGGEREALPVRDSPGAIAPPPRHLAHAEIADQIERYA